MENIGAFDHIDYSILQEKDLLFYVSANELKEITKQNKTIVMGKKIAINFKLVTSVELDGFTVRIWFSDTDYVNKKYDTEKDAEKSYEQVVKDFNLYKFI